MSAILESPVRTAETGHPCAQFFCRVCGFPVADHPLAGDPHRAEPAGLHR